MAYIISHTVTYTSGLTVTHYLVRRGLFIELGRREDAKMFTRKADAQKEAEACGIDYMVEKA